MKLLLTSGGIKNPSIQNALVALLGKPIAEANALCITTASYGHPMAGPAKAWSFISGREIGSMCELGWKSLGVLELTALPSIGHWIRESGLANLLPSLPEMVWAGLSAGSMVMTPRIGADFVQWTPPTGGDETLGLVDFSIFPHLDNPDLPKNTMANAERWAADIAGPAYVIDDETAITVVDSTVEVVSEGHWHLLNR